MWVFRGGTPEHPRILFEYHPSRAGDVAASFLNGYEGVVQTDGYKGYDFLDVIKGIYHMACWVHVRRKFLDVIKVAGKSENGKKKPGHADTAYVTPDNNMAENTIRPFVIGRKNWLFSAL